MTTLTQPLEISVLAAPLAAIDRRALSQAWYSALGYAAPCHSEGDAFCHPERSANGVSAKSKDQRAPWRRSLDSARLARYARDDKAHSHAIGAPSVRSAASVVERRRDSKLAQRVERKLLLKVGQRARASVAVAGGRVHLVLQHRGERLHVVAFCPKRLEAAVARALAQARYALARRGISAQALLNGGA